jgi:hypothetical protein
LVSLLNAIEKLEHLGFQLPFPHSSGIQGVDGELRELRPRGGASPWRALYGTVEKTFVILTVCPEANKNRKLFDKAVRVAIQRLAEVEE